MEKLPMAQTCNFVVNMKKLRLLLFVFLLPVTVGASEKTLSILRDGVEFVGVGAWFVFDGGSVFMDFGNSDNTRTYILVRNRNPHFGGKPDYQQFYVSDQRKMKERIEIIEGSEVEKIILAKAENFYISDSSNERMKNNLRQLIYLLKNRKLPWETGENSWYRQL